MPHISQGSGTIDNIVDALKQLTQAQTDTLALIALIVFAIVLGLIATLGYLVYRSRVKVAIPATAGQPAQLVSQNEFIGILYNTFLGRLEALNSQNDKLGDRLEQSLGINEKLVPAVQNLQTWAGITATSTEVSGLSNKVDAGFSAAVIAGKGLGSQMEEIHKDTVKIVESDAELLAKVTAVLEELGRLGKQGDEIRKELNAAVVKIEAILKTLETKEKTNDSPISDVSTTAK